MYTEHLHTPADTAIHEMREKEEDGVMGEETGGGGRKSVLGSHFRLKVN